MYGHLREDRWKEAVRRLRTHFERELSDAEDCYLDLGGVKTVRLVVADPEAWNMIRRELGWVVTDPVASPDASITLLKYDSPKDFFRDAMGLPFIHSEEARFETICLIPENGEDGKLFPTAQYNRDDQTVHLRDDNSYYYVTKSYRPEDWINEGHVFVQMLFRILNTEPSTCLVHGACVGAGGHGILMCARGNMGKSTLAVTSMLNGMEYVSEDYLILSRANPEGELRASPIYSIITLSPRMYNVLYEKMDKARFVGISHFKGKYVFDMSAYSDRLRRDYPIRACVFPEINLSAMEPAVELVSGSEKSRAITQIAHSTIFQMWSSGLIREQQDAKTILKIIGMVRDLPFYRITLTTDLDANSGCLRKLVSSL
ncbi:MAG: hypothetical protein IKW99_05090 [Bacteroidales bacterium]|nr:hypothetical protein [Bacteroidales bacterium]